ncbi:prolyl oligopeptidase family serine peptidase [Paremcibacter congregatus]|uniref:prolyl oligopeptidase family serine peptidase n=1 Tax=Paremcibacter congregatus TaxID=2043170 RepID=UPI003A9147B0
MGSLRWVGAVAAAVVAFSGTSISTVTAEQAESNDIDQSLLWLEEVEGEKALDWVRTQNAATLAKLTKDPMFSGFKQQAYDILTAADRITSGTLRGGYVYNFWRDKTHVRGIWRRATVESYKAGAAEWDTLLDVDALAKAEDKNWVYKGASCLAPDYTRCLIDLSPGGTDATTYREFDVTAKAFVDGGFQVPLAKTNLGWEDQDTLLIGTDWGPDDQGVSAMNSSGYPRIMKRWKRGTPLADATTVLETGHEETFSFPFSFDRPEGKAVFVMRGHDFYHATYYLVDGNGQLQELPLPKKIGVSGMFKGQILVILKEDWRGHNKGSLVSFDLQAFRDSGEIATLTPVFDPGLAGTIENVVVTKDKVYTVGLEHVSSRIREFSLDNGVWQGRKIDFGGEDVFSIKSASGSSNDMLMARDGLLTPPSLYFVNFVAGEEVKLQSLPPRFDTKDLKLEKRFATSKDGTKIPYFIVYKDGAKLDKSTPVLQYGYGGFEISILPHYSGLRGKLWLEKGGAYVIANIRGGGEYGPRWHQAALLENRQRAYEDFFAVAEEVQNSGLSSPEHYGIDGRSNGGLLMGVSFTQRPDLFNAVICGVPLLDMKRYNKLLAGASWMAEYGNPDTDDWDFIQKYSPLQNLKKDMDYPTVYFFTSTKDDRVHPGHARKMAAKMAAYGHPFYYYENIEGGHKGNANYDQEATMRALEYVYLWRQLGQN